MWANAGRLRANIGRACNELGRHPLQFWPNHGLGSEVADGGRRWANDDNFLGTVEAGVLEWSRWGGTGGNSHATRSWRKRGCVMRPAVGMPGRTTMTSTRPAAPSQCWRRRRQGHEEEAIPMRKALTLKAGQGGDRRRRADERPRVFSDEYGSRRQGVCATCACGHGRVSDGPRCLFPTRVTEGTPTIRVPKPGAVMQIHVVGMWLRCPWQNRGCPKVEGRRSIRNAINNSGCLRRTGHAAYCH